jgi:hypothetical protein
MGVSRPFPRAEALPLAFERAGDGDPAMNNGFERRGVVAVASCISSSARSELGNSIGGDEGGGEDMFLVVVDVVRDEAEREGRDDEQKMGDHHAHVQCNAFVTPRKC